MDLSDSSKNEKNNKSKDDVVPALAKGALGCFAALGWESLKQVGSAVIFVATEIL